MKKIKANSSFIDRDKNSYSDPDSSSELIPWIYWNELAREELWKRVTLLVNKIFAEPVMGVVSLFLFIILILSDLVPLSSGILGILNILDVAIWIFFILEYVSKLIVASDRLSFFLKPWHIVDLIIITLPFLALLIGSGYEISRYMRVLRGVQTLQVLIRGGVTAKKHLTSSEFLEEESNPVSMRIRKLSISEDKTGSGTSEHLLKLEPCNYGDISKNGKEPSWIDISFWTEEDLIRISEITHLPIYILESKLRENAYPRADIHDKIISFFIKNPVLIHDPIDTRKWRLYWPGLLLLLSGSSVFTISKITIPQVEQVPELINNINAENLGEEILYELIKGALETIDRMITDAEAQLVFLESQQDDFRPSNFLKMVYRIRKELGNMISWLLHTREGLNLLSKELNTDEAKRLLSLIDQCNTLTDNATLTQTAFTNLSGYYLDSNGYQMNWVMKFLAVLAALTMVPALIGGLLGMNLIDEPWPATLIQILTVIALIMIFTTWVYYKIGWLSR